MFSVRWIPGFLLSIMTFLSVCDGNAQEKIKMPSNVSYCDEDTGVVFRPAISVFRKTMVCKNTNPVYGTNISYAGPHASCTADIYIYALNTEPAVISQKEFQNHCKEILRQIFTQTRQKHEIINFELKNEFQMTENKKILAYLAKFTFMLDEENYFSCLLMLPCGNRIIKVRITMPSESPESIRQADEFIAAVCKLYIKKNKAVFVPLKTAEPGKGK